MSSLPSSLAVRKMKGDLRDSKIHRGIVPFVVGASPPNSNRKENKTMKLTLHPIVTNQIMDAIEGTTPNITQKRQLLKENNILSVNGKRVYRAYVDDEYIYYFLRMKSQTKYYYPIAFATVEITTDESKGKEDDR